MILYVHTDGLLGMAVFAPADTLPLLRAEPEALRHAVQVIADPVDDNGNWRVPGLVQGQPELARLNALEHFAGRCRFWLGRR